MDVKELLADVRSAREGCTDWDGDLGYWINAERLGEWVAALEALQPTDWRQVAREHMAVTRGEADFVMQPDCTVTFVPRAEAAAS